MLAFLLLSREKIRPMGQIFRQLFQHQRTEKPGYWDFGFLGIWYF
jgi:hypothetical protein